MNALIVRPAVGRLAAAVLVAGVLQACETVPYTERQQLVLISEDQEIALGAKAYEQILDESKLSDDDAANRMVRRIGSRIAAVADKNDYEWEFRVIQDDKTANAFALPGGKVAVYTGLLPITQDEAGLAVVMGHEIAHALARHGAERMSQTELANLVGAGLLEMVNAGDPRTVELVRAAYGATAQIGFLLPYGRAQESEADRIGLILMAKAGYDPRRAVEFWRRMAQQSKGSPPEFLSTHPNDERRIAQIEQWMPEAMKYYERSRSDQARRPKAAD
jgi:predicted Zn-dependent protease